MSAGPIRAERLATTATPIPAWNVGQIVTPEQHPADCDRWRVTKTDGVIVDLEPVDGSSVRRIRRHARTLRVSS